MREGNAHEKEKEKYVTWKNLAMGRETKRELTIRKICDSRNETTCSGVPQKFERGKTKWRAEKRRS